jgi:antitoxin VapB
VRFERQVAPLREQIRAVEAKLGAFGECARAAATDLRAARRVAGGEAFVYTCGLRYIYGVSGVGIIVKNAKTEAKIRRLAKRTGETLTAAIDRAVDDRLARLGPPPRKKRRIDRKKLAELLAYFDSLPRMNEHLTDDEIIGYDEYGLPK